jgi:hypothetical protein
MPVSRHIPRAIPAIRKIRFVPGSLMAFLLKFGKVMIDGLGCLFQVNAV